MTYTVAVLEISEEAFKEIAAKLIDAGYEHVFDADDKGNPMVDMTHILLKKEEHT